MLYFFIQRILRIMSLLMRKLFHKLLEDICTRVRDRIYGMPHSVDQSLPVKRFLVKKSFKISADLIVIFPVSQVLLHILEHLGYFDIRTAVLRSL